MTSQSFADATVIITAINVSPQQQINCDQSCKFPVLGTNCNQGCDGGYLDQALAYLSKEGTVSDSCNNYVAKQQTCSGYTCDSGAEASIVFYADGCHKLSGEMAMMNEIYANGPILAGFTIYENFVEYEGGVYDAVSGPAEGGHAVRIIGWGEDAGKPYWLCANSWGTSWGLNGYFKFLRGSDLCGIESNVVATTPDVDQLMEDSEGVDNNSLRDPAEEYFNPSSGAMLLSPLAVLVGFLL
ncbi:Cathepsin B [Balamuthia mandrillaris]